MSVLLQNRIKIIIDGLENALADCEQKNYIQALRFLQLTEDDVKKAIDICKEEIGK